VPGDGQKVFLGPLRPYGVATALKMWECSIALDPTFWKALGKALGWDRNWRDPLKDWDTVAGKFYQEVLHGHDIDEFLTELLEAKQ
jgi:hypothetical protein